MATIRCTECDFVNPPRARQCRRCQYPFQGQWPSLVGKTVGNYELVRRIGGGGFGAVYEARHVTLGNPVAVKILHPRLATNPNFYKNFQKEALLLAGLRHENVVQVLDFGREEQVGFYLIMEWLEGHSLAVIRRKHKRPDWGWLFTLFSQLLDALDYAHQRGIVHRDLKPDNLLITWGGRGRMVLKIVDFGIATLVESTPDPNTPAPVAKGSSRRSATVAGTAFYMAPEQVKGEIDRMGSHTDLYACGILLGELLTGRRVFMGRNPVHTMRMQVEMPPPPLHRLDPDGPYSDALQHVYLTALQKDPNLRFATAHEFYTLLRVAFEGMNIAPVDEDIYRPNYEESQSSSNLYRPQTTELHAAETSSLEDLPSHSASSASLEDLVKATSGDFPQYSSPNQPKAESSASLMWVGLALVLMLCLGTLGFLFVNKLKAGTHSNTNATTQNQPTKPKARKAHKKKKLKLKQDPPQREAPKRAAPGSEDSDDDEDDDDDSDDSGAKPSAKSKQPKKSRKTSRKRRRKRRTLPQQRTKPKAAPTPSMVWLSVKTKPSGGSVVVNGDMKGKAPLRIKVVAGTAITVKVSKSGYVTKTYQFKLKRNKTMKVQLIEDLF